MSQLCNTCVRSHRDRDFTKTWAVESLEHLLKPKSILSSLLPLHKTIAVHEEESSVFMSLYMREILTGKGLWERRSNGQSLTLPSTPTPQSASWIMLTSFPPSPMRKQKPWRCQDSHQDKRVFQQTRPKFGLIAHHYFSQKGKRSAWNLPDKERWKEWLTFQAY